MKKRERKASPPSVVNCQWPLASSKRASVRRVPRRMCASSPKRAVPSAPVPVKVVPKLLTPPATRATWGSLDSLPDHKTVVLDCIPTVENLASTAFDILKDVYQDTYGTGLSLSKITLYETPNCWAEVHAGDKQPV